MHDNRTERSWGLLTDFYELTMMQGYFLERHDPHAVFDMFFRNQPFSGGFSIFAGLDDLLEMVESLSFSGSDIEYLEGTGMFRPEFLRYLENFRFNGDVYAFDEGSAVFPGEPLIRVSGTLMETQLIESLLLNLVNFQTLIATKTARIYLAAAGKSVLEFGLRRAQGIDGALSAARASFIGGAAATSNTLAAKLYGIPARGTMAHSWVMSYDSEEAAFRAYAELYPESTIFLIDTYDTLGSGIRNAITVGKELAAKGKSFGVRLDSGDLQYLSVKVRQLLDREGLQKAFITASNELNEEIIHQLVTDGAPIDTWGVGTHLVTGGNQSALTGVYKLASRQHHDSMVPVLKVSNNPEKTTNPGIKQVYRFSDDNGMLLADLIALDDETVAPGTPHMFRHPSIVQKKFLLSEYARIEAMLKPKMLKGKIVDPRPPLQEIRSTAIANLAKLDASYKRIINPHVYKVSLTQNLWEMKIRLLNGDH